MTQNLLINANNLSFLQIMKSKFHKRPKEIKKMKLSNEKLS